MKTVTIQEAENNFAGVLRLVRRGEEVALTSREKTVARIVPVTSGSNGKQAAAAIKQRKAAWAEHLKKLIRIYGGKPAPGKPASEIIIDGRR